MFRVSLLVGALAVPVAVMIAAPASADTTTTSPSNPIAANIARSVANFNIWKTAITTGTRANYITFSPPNNGRKTPYGGYATPPIRGIHDGP